MSLSICNPRCAAFLHLSARQGLQGRVFPSWKRGRASYLVLCAVLDDEHSPASAGRCDAYVHGPHSSLQRKGWLVCFYFCWVLVADVYSDLRLFCRSEKLSVKKIKTPVLRSWNTSNSCILSSGRISSRIPRSSWK